jgi:solute:Na+ symporter, SSS family
MAPIDWASIVFILGVMFAGLWLSRGHMNSVSDFLAASRTADRYVVSVASGVAALGAITVIGNMEMNYAAGLPMTWWGLTMSVVVLCVHLSGWVLYRFRETRCLTLAEFFERRYSRGFRVFAGLLAFGAGIVNFGIFPAVSTRFFIYYCNLPHVVQVGGVSVATFPVLMAAFLVLALVFVFLGGQVAVIITNFLQGVFVNLVFLVLCVYLLMRVVSWDQIFAALASAPADASLLNPFKTSAVPDFNFWYFLIGAFGVIYGQMSWQGTQAYNASAKSAHEAKMSQALAMWKQMPQLLFLLFGSLVVYTLLHHPDFAGLAGKVEGAMTGIDREALRSQLRPSLTLQQVLPPGLLGAFAAVMLACMISNDESYLHSWGSIFIQDVLLPLRHGRPLTQKQHLLALRLSILGVAIFIYCFALLFQQTQYIFLFFAITGAIFAGGSGAVIIGGLYWKRGTTPAAWSALFTGATIAVGGIVLQQLDPNFPINGQQFWAIAMGASSVVYVLVSLLGPQPREGAVLDRLLHRGEYAVADDHVQRSAPISRGLRLLFFTREFSRGDKILYIATYAWVLGWFTVFVTGTIINFTRPVADAEWIRFWKAYLVIMFAASIIIFLWFTTGGVRGLFRMTRRLRTQSRDRNDDGVVR